MKEEEAQQYAEAEDPAYYGLGIRMVGGPRPGWDMPQGSERCFSKFKQTTIST